MKKTLLAVMMSAAMTSTLVQAIGAGSLEIRGEVVRATPRTCSMTVDGGSNLQVTLDPVNIETLKEINAQSESTPFKLQLTGCAAANTSAKLVFKGVAASENENYFKNLGSGDEAATGFAVMIEEADGAIYTPNKDGSAHDTTDGNLEVDFKAKIIRISESVKEGYVKAMPAVSVNYD